MKKSILIIDDDKNIVQYLTDALEGKGYFVKSSLDSRQGLQLYRSEQPFLVLTDLKMDQMDQMDGMGVIEAIRKEDSQARIIMMTGFASVETAVQAMKKGAMDYLAKPFDLEDLLRIIANIEESEVMMESVGGSEVPDATGLMRELGLQSQAMRDVLALVVKVARTDATVLLQGESGVGKEIIAQAIHRLSLRSGNAFVTIDCGAMPEPLLESELFGHVQGSFTGADKDHSGLFKKSSGGTLMLDEIGNMGLGLQSKLLRVLQEKTVKPVGSVHEEPVDIRVIAASNKNLRWEIDQGSFRKDLFYRLDVFTIYIPPLRDRKEDLETLIPYRLKQLEAKGLPAKRIDRAALELLEAYPWPGNVRELYSVLEKAVILSESDTILPANLSEDIRSPKGTKDFKSQKEKIVGDFEKNFIEDLLRKHQGNISGAAREMDISRKSLYQKMKDLGIKAD